MYCPACGESIGEEARYCRYCGEEISSQKIEIEDDEVPDIYRFEKVEHQCQTCGEMLSKNNPPCKHCGGMDIESRRIDPEGTNTGDESANRETNDAVTGDSSWNFFWPPGPLLRVQAVCLIGAQYIMLGSYIAGVWYGALEFVRTWGYFILGLSFAGAIISWFVDTIFVYKKTWQDN